MFCICISTNTLVKLHEISAFSVTSQLWCLMFQNRLGVDHFTLKFTTLSILSVFPVQDARNANPLWKVKAWHLVLFLRWSSQMVMNYITSIKTKRRKSLTPPYFPNVKSHFHLDFAANPGDRGSPTQFVVVVLTALLLYVLLNWLQEQRFLQLQW